MTTEGKPDVFYYVETAITPDDDHTRTRFRAHIAVAKTPRLAEADAMDDDRALYPNEEVGHFLSRRLTPERAEKILRLFDEGRWEGWFESAFRVGAS